MLLANGRRHGQSGLDKGEAMLKTHACGQLRLDHVDEEVTLAGWVHRRRDHGALIFIDLRDREGIVQVVVDAERAPEAHKVADALRVEYVVQVKGVVRARPEGLRNPKIPTGDIEVEAREVTILNPAKTPPFYINEDVPVDEALRLKYRYLDLRKERMQRNLILRHRVVNEIRQFLNARGFLEIETPLLIKTTPEGARDFIVPSRLHPGKFYALPQSPQQLKQLLMVAGYEKYYQIARCLRDEDLRADRQPEFTQLDLEMSFVEQDDILQLIEALYIHLVEALLPEKRVKETPFPRLTYAEAMARFGSDKPDLRFGMEFVDLTDIVAASEFRVFRQTVENGGQVKGIVVPDAAGYSRKELDQLGDIVAPYGAKGVLWMAFRQDGVRSPAAKFLKDGEINAIRERAAAHTGDLLLIIADQPDVLAASLGQLRLAMGDRLGLRDPDELAFAWVVEFPLLEWNEDENRWEAMHHPFTSPVPEDWALADTDPGKMRALAHDSVLNGWEVGGGSIRIHRREEQQKMFELLGISPEEAQRKFGHMLEAFEYGAPPHGGIALGLDRLVAIFANETSIREVMAFPKTTSAQDLMLGAPSEVSEEQLKELHLKVVP